MAYYGDESYNQKRLLFLIGKVPNWEVHLTDKQLECVKLYISTLDASMVDDKLNLGRGTSHSRLFGSKTSKGALGKLEEAYKKLEKYGYFDKKEEKNNQKHTSKSIMSEKTLNKVKELFKIVTELENYNQYLNKYQKEKLYQFLTMRSFKECAKYFDIKENTFKQNLLGRNDDDNSCILGKLRKIYNEQRVNSWDEI